MWFVFAVTSVRNSYHLESLLNFGANKGDCVHFDSFMLFLFYFNHGNSKNCGCLSTNQMKLKLTGDSWKSSQIIDYLTTLWLVISLFENSLNIFLHLFNFWINLLQSVDFCVKHLSRLVNKIEWNVRISPPIDRNEYDSNRKHEAITINKLCNHFLCWGLNVYCM